MTQYERAFFLCIGVNKIKGFFLLGVAEYERAFFIGVNKIKGFILLGVAEYERAFFLWV